MEPTPASYHISFIWTGCLYQTFTIISGFFTLLEQSSTKNQSEPAQIFPRLNLNILGCTLFKFFCGSSVCRKVKYWCLDVLVSWWPRSWTMNCDMSPVDRHLLHVISPHSSYQLQPQNCPQNSFIKYLVLVPVLKNQLLYWHWCKKLRYRQKQNYQQLQSLIMWTN